MLMARAFLLLVLLIVQQEQSSPYKVSCGPQPRPLEPIFKLPFNRCRRSAVDVCSDFTTASTPYSFVFPRGFHHLPRPWIDNPTATTGTSATVTQGMNHLFSLRVPGLGGQTVADVVDELEREGCLSFPWGESVRDLFFGELLWDLDMESNCDADTLQSICLEKWGLSNCHRSKRSIVHIGVGEEKAKDEETNNIEAANWNETFFGDGTSLEYTTNSISYFGYGLNIVIDITGNGVNDTCNKKIRIPVATDVRDKWASPLKLYCFWKLRVKGYTAADTDTMTYIIVGAKNAILKESEELQRFYCQIVLIGNWTSSQCSVPSESC